MLPWVAFSFLVTTEEMPFQYVYVLEPMKYNRKKYRLCFQYVINKNQGIDLFMLLPVKVSKCFSA